MIFAAGRGSRLGALGERTPKALIEIAGLTMLERTARSLVGAGARRVVVNVHHHADRIERFLAERDLGAEIVLSREPGGPLETGGGLLHARDLFHRDGPLLLHNVDVICRADLRELVDAHARSGALAMLAVNERETARYLLFDDLGLVGREDRGCAQRSEVRPPRGAVRALAFAGIQVCAPAILDLIEERGVFPIVDLYLRLAGSGRRIEPWRLANDDWIEIGNPERLAAARRRLEGNRTL